MTTKEIILTFNTQNADRSGLLMTEEAIDSLVATSVGQPYLVDDTKRGVIVSAEKVFDVPGLYKNDGDCYVIFCVEMDSEVFEQNTDVSFSYGIKKVKGVEIEEVGFSFISIGQKLKPLFSISLIPEDRLLDKHCVVIDKINGN